MKKTKLSKVITSSRKISKSNIYNKEITVTLQDISLTRPITGMGMCQFTGKDQLRNIQLCSLDYDKKTSEIDKQIECYGNDDTDINGNLSLYSNICHNTRQGGNRKKIEEGLYLFQEITKDFVVPLDNVAQRALLYLVINFPVMFWKSKLWREAFIGKNGKNKEEREKRFRSKGSFNFKKGNGEKEQENKRYVIKVLVQIIVQILQEEYMNYYQDKVKLEIGEEKTVDDFKNYFKISDDYLVYHECDFVHKVDSDYKKKYPKYRIDTQFLDDNKERISNMVKKVDVITEDDFKNVVLDIENLILDFRNEVHSEYNLAKDIYEEEQEWIPLIEDLEEAKSSILEEFDGLESKQKYLVANYFHVLETLITDPIFLTGKKKEEVYLFHLLCRVNLLPDEFQKILIDYMKNQKKCVYIKTLKDDEKLKENFSKYEILKNLNIENMIFDDNQLKKQFEENYLSEDFLVEYYPLMKKKVRGNIVEPGKFGLFQSVITIEKKDFDFILTFLKCRTRNNILKKLEELEKLCKEKEKQ